METWIKYIGAAAQRIVSHADLANLGADFSKVEHMAENDALSFMRNAAVKVEDEVAHVLTTHPSLTGEFTTTADPTTDPASAETPVSDENTAESPTTTPSAIEGSPQTEASAPATAPAAEDVAPNAGSAS